MRGGSKRLFGYLIAAISVIAALLTGVAPAAAVPGAGSTLFINELHYDNSGADTGEFVEVAGPAGTDLSGWSIVLYNGSSSVLDTYGTISLSGTLADLDGGYGVASFDRAGIQNGSPDGLALVDPGGDVVQFLSYEGTFTASGGPAAGETSTDIGVSEASSTPVGESLQLTGTGTMAGDFTWAAPAAETPGTPNNGQSFDGNGNGPGDPVLNEYSVSTTSTDVEYFEIHGDAATDYSAWSVLEIQGITEGSDTPGQVVDEFEMGTTDANGIFVANLAANTIENDPITILLVEDFTGTVGDDLDPGDDGTFDTEPWATLGDSVSVQYDAGIAYSTTVHDEAFDDATYSGDSDGFAPGGASRVPDGSGGWVRNDFDLAGIDDPGGPEEGEALNTPGAPNELVEVIDPPGDPVFIHEVQGDGATVAISGPVTIQGVVTSLFEDNDALDGFFVQEEDADADADPQTSEGIFVFCRGSCPGALAAGDQVTVNGDATDFFGMSQVDATGGSITIDSSGNPLPAPVVVDLPAPGRTDAEATFENLEAMVVQFSDTLAISEYFQHARYGQLVLTEDARPEQFTDANAPSVAGYSAFLDDLATRRLILDDDDNDQNDPIAGPDSNEAYPWPVGGLSTTNRFRGGETITDLVGVLHWSFAGQTGTDAWRVRQVPGEDYTFAADNPREATPPDVGGSLKVASFNVLNYFTTINEGGNLCGPGNDLECRGAHSAAELDRQRDKIVSALVEIDADVVGLIEIENDDGASVADLVGALNAELGAGTYDYVDTGFIGTDAIKVAFVYQPATVSAVGDHAILDSSVDPTFVDDRNRPVLIQTFEEKATGGRVTVAVNHLKSKGSACDDIGDPDLGDGQANCNQTRTDAAEAMAAYLATDPTGSGDSDALIMGDLNAYAMEDPITALEAAGYTDLVEQFGGTGAYSYVFDGQLGYLDHALANEALQPQVTGTEVWHINADEPVELDYNDDVLDGNEASFERESSALPLFSPDPFRSSDHDPVIVGLDLGGDALEAWDPTTVYDTGDRVTYQDRVFEALWWTRNQEPGASPWGPWQEIATAPDGTAVWTPTRIFDTGDVVVHEGGTWQAMWWTRNQEPGASPWGPWESIG